MSRVRLRAGWLPLLAALLAAVACGAAEDKPGLLELTAGTIKQQARSQRPIAEFLSSRRCCRRVAACAAPSRHFCLSRCRLVRAHASRTGRLEMGADGVLRALVRLNCCAATWPVCTAPTVPPALLCHCLDQRSIAPCSPLWPPRCPACQRFQPEYEKVAAFFAARGEAEPVVTVARLDCANFVRCLPPAAAWLLADWHADCRQLPVWFLSRCTTMVT